MKSNSLTTLLTYRLLNAEGVLRQLRHLASHLPCQLCELKGGSNLMEDGGCRHRGSIVVDTFDLDVLEKVERFFKAHHPNLSACNECGGMEVAEASNPSGHAYNTNNVRCADHSCANCHDCEDYMNEMCGS